MKERFHQDYSKQINNLMININNKILVAIKLTYEMSVYMYNRQNVMTEKTLRNKYLLHKKKKTVNNMWLYHEFLTFVKGS